MSSREENNDRTPTISQAELEQGYECDEELTPAAHSTGHVRDVIFNVRNNHQNVTFSDDEDDDSVTRSSIVGGGGGGGTQFAPSHYFSSLYRSSYDESSSDDEEPATLEDKRKKYKCGNNFTTLANIVTWEDYVKQKKNLKSMCVD